MSSMKVVLTNDGSRTLYAEDVSEIFHSRAGAYTESRTVFLENSGVSDRLKQGLATSVFEIGFGTGLNFFLTADQAIGCDTALHYFGVDTWQIDPATLEQLAYQPLLNTPYLVQRFLDALKRSETHVEWNLPPVQLSWSRRSAVENTGPGDLDAIYHDAFSPAAAQELWTAEFLGQLLLRLKPGGVLATYCVKSQVQRTLTKVGFHVEKLPGPVGGKREVLIAVRVD